MVRDRFSQTLHSVLLIPPSLFLTLSNSFSFSLGLSYAKDFPLLPRRWGLPERKLLFPLTLPSEKRSAQNSPLPRVAFSCKVCSAIPESNYYSQSHSRSHFLPFLLMFSGFIIPSLFLPLSSLSSFLILSSLSLHLFSLFLSLMDASTNRKTSLNLNFTEFSVFLSPSHLTIIKSSIVS